MTFVLDWDVIPLDKLDEGDPCPTNYGCNGAMQYTPNGDCGCGWPNARPPCWACENSILECDNCGWVTGDSLELDSGC